MMIIALIGSSFFGAIAALFGIFGLDLGLFAAFGLYMGTAMAGIMLALIAQLGRQSRPELEMTRAT